MSTTITIRNLDNQVKLRLRVIAAQHGKSMEAEARDILTRATFANMPHPEPELSPQGEGHRSPARGKCKHLGITTDAIMALTRDKASNTRKVEQKRLTSPTFSSELMQKSSVAPS